MNFSGALQNIGWIGDIIAFEAFIDTLYKSSEQILTRL